MKAIMTKGLPASGKTFWAKKFCADNGYLRINNDDIRRKREADLGLTSWNKDVEKFTNNERERLCREAAAGGQNIVVDNTHLNPKTFKRTKDLLESLGYDVVVKDFTGVPYDLCVDRDNSRKGVERVGADVIFKMYNNYIKPKGTPLPDWNTDNPNLGNAIVVDIDGTLADGLARNPYDLKKVGEDVIRKFVLVTIYSLYKTLPNLKVFIFSGREDVCFEDTCVWLRDKCNIYVENNGGILEAPDGSEEYIFAFLGMRKAKDNSRDSKVKGDLFDNLVKDKYNVFAVFDDRQQVVSECWKARNLPTFRVGLVNEDIF